MPPTARGSIRHLARRSLGPAIDWWRTRRLRTFVHQLARHPERTPDQAALESARQAWANGPWTASSRYLEAVIDRVRHASGPVLECGAGLSTLVAAASGRGTDHALCSLEHEPAWAHRVRGHLQALELDDRAAVIDAPLSSYDGYDWYTPGVSLPRGISLVLCDGPPGATPGGRYGLLPRCRDHLAPAATILLDDASRPGESEVLERWTREFGVSVEMIDAPNPYAVVRCP